MSHAHIRVSNPPLRNRVLERWVLACAGVFALGLAVFTLWDRPHEPVITTRGHVLDTRIVVDNIRSGTFGGRIDYRLEVRVAYDLAGTPQDRWITADTLSTERETIAAQIASHPQSCFVYWGAEYPDGARCRLP